MSKTISQRLEEYDFLRVAQELDFYSHEGANTVLISLPASTSLFGSFISVSVTINEVNLPSTQDGFAKVLEAWLDWPPAHRSEHLGRQAISLTKIEAAINGVLIETKLSQSENSTEIFVLLSSAQKIKELKITFSTPSCYFLLPGRAPFERSMLNINLALVLGSKYTLLYLEHPEDISLRARVDNADYHSLAYASESGGIRKISFFRYPIVNIRYFWGSNETRRLTAPALPLYVAGISLIAAAFTLALVNSNLSDLASAVLALALLPPAVQLFSQQRLFFPSTDITRYSFTDWMSLISLGIYLPLIILTGWALAFMPTIRGGLETVNFLVGSFLLICGGIYLFLLNGGVFQNYTCDKCERRIFWRKNTYLHIPTRRTLCKNCWNSQLTLDATNQDKTS